MQGMSVGPQLSIEPSWTVLIPWLQWVIFIVNLTGLGVSMKTRLLVHLGGSDLEDF